MTATLQLMATLALFVALVLNIGLMVLLNITYRRTRREVTLLRETVEASIRPAPETVPQWMIDEDGR